ncbi:uncharacterized protein LOC116620384 [Nematostella vectensis]|uniref:uncharacterized protein LOC116620384 n=1 Tax=Nematostella vectensis TaxID=45351 RepID=UPI00138FBC46|nr:uncharacterized protein LOC116620384 [Nematostella vectensis]
MQALLITVAVISVITTGAQAINPCEQTIVSKCVTSYISEFIGNTSTNKLDVHCTADKNLAFCVRDGLRGGCGGDLVRSLGRAVLSYIVMDRKLNVCRWQGYWTLFQLLYPDSEDDDCDQIQNDSDDDDNSLTKREKFLRLLRSTVSSQYRACAHALDEGCVQKFVTNMQSSPDLCVNIPKKYQCLQAGIGACPARVLTSLLAIFPPEATNVLTVLCNP